MPSVLRRRCVALSGVLALAGVVVTAQSSTAPPAFDLGATVDRIAQSVLCTTGVPSASVAVVRDGTTVLARASGEARLARR